MRNAFGAAAAAMTILAAGCTGGGGSPEEALETYNAHMASKDFDGAARVVYLEAWEHLPAGEVAASRKEYVARLAEAYDDGHLDYGRAEIKDRGKMAAEVVMLTVEYRRRDEPSAPPILWAMPFKCVGGAWYYFIPEPPAPGPRGGSR